MRRFLFACLIIFSVVSCGGGKHEPEVLDSRLIKSPDSNSARELIDSINGGKVDTTRPTDRNPQ